MTLDIEDCLIMDFKGDVGVLQHTKTVAKRFIYIPHTGSVFIHYRTLGLTRSDYNERKTKNEGGPAK